MQLSSIIINFLTILTYDHPTSTKPRISSPILASPPHLAASCANMPLCVKIARNHQPPIHAIQSANPIGIILTRGKRLTVMKASRMPPCL